MVEIYSPIQINMYPLVHLRTYITYKIYHHNVRRTYIVHVCIVLCAVTMYVCWVFGSSVTLTPYERHFCRLFSFRTHFVLRTNTLQTDAVGKRVRRWRRTAIDPITSGKMRTKAAFYASILLNIYTFKHKQW